MKCSLSIFTISVTILVTLFIVEIRCCSDNTNDIISLMYEDTNYQQNPCYIKWKAAQDAKLEQLWRDRAVLEASIARDDKIRRENEKIERQNWQNSFRTTTVVKKKESSVLMILGIIAGVIVGICCCLACCACITSEDNVNARAHTNTLQSDCNPGALTTTMITTNDNHSNLIVSGMETRRSTFPSREFTPQQLTEIDVHLLPRDVINRQNSLPTYEDAITMPSAPPKE